jgi:hypothetical protein
MQNAKEMKMAIKEAIKEQFGGIDNYGCYAGSIDCEAWLSTESMFKLVCRVIDNNKHLFEDYDDDDEYDDDEYEDDDE